MDESPKQKGILPKLDRPRQWLLGQGSKRMGEAGSRDRTARTALLPRPRPAVHLHPWERTGDRGSYLVDNASVFNNSLRTHYDQVHLLHDVAEEGKETRSRFLRSLGLPCEG